MNYPTDDPYVRLYKPEYIRSHVFDEHYPYINDSLYHRFLHVFGYAVILNFCIRILLRIQMDLKIEGRERLRAYKDVLKGGFISIGNHCQRHDAEAILMAVKAKNTTKIPMFSANFNTKDEIFLHMVGGVPIPPAESGMAAMKQFNLAFDEFHQRGYSFHIFPEAAKWEEYRYLRPFQKGAFTMAYKYNMPIIPTIIVFRPRTGIFRLFGPAEKPLMTVRVCEPVVPDTTQPRKNEVERMLVTAHERMIAMAGIENNPWPAIWDK